MNTNYWTKKDLYNQIDILRYEFGFDNNFNNYPISSIELAENRCPKLNVEYLNFTNSNICGILYKGDFSTSIALNINRDAYMQNFDCMHELIHFFIHDITFCQLICSENVILQNSYIEWQANEGAAQFLVPYQLFIPKYIELEELYADNPISADVETTLAKIFNVSYKMIENRISNLDKEIAQYKFSRNINNISIISRTKAIKLGINDIISKRYYCTNCLSIINKDYLYCPICGKYLKRKHFFEFNIWKGVGFMIYPKDFNIDENGKPSKCPNCQNEELSNGNYCHICGAYLLNECTQCNQPAGGNARYCHDCGGETTFYKENYLLPVEKDYKIQKLAQESHGEFIKVDDTEELPF